MPEAPTAAQGSTQRDFGELCSAAQTIGQDLGALLREAIDGLGRSKSGLIAELEARVAGLATLAEEVSTLKTDFAALKAEAVSQSEEQQSFSARLASIETALRTQEESQPQLLERLQQSVRMQQESLIEKAESQAVQLQAVAELVAQLRAHLAQLQEGQHVLLKRLDLQAEALRDLHHAAQEQAGRKDELRAAVEKLETIVSSPAGIKPLPAEI